MGITGLLPFLKKVHEPVNIAKFAGCTVAIDAYCWLHKGAFSCAEKLVLGEKTDQYVYYCMKFLEYMLKNNLKPILVFDGCHLPSKADVEKSRREKRDMNRKKAAKLLREGNRAEARDCLQKCVDISPEMALRLMEVCRERGIDCIQAPYEADAQLAYLSKAGIAQIIVTEDSDLLLFGCEKVIFKMDTLGNGIMIQKSRLNEVLEIQNGLYTFDKFRYMCILSGCDYLPSLPGIGLAKACKVFKLARQTDMKTLLKKFPSTYLKMSLVVSNEYIEGFTRADNTFLYQLVFDPLSRKLIPLNDYSDGLSSEDLPYAGSVFPPEKAFQIALGNINIYNKQKFADFDPDVFVPSKASKKKPQSLHMLSIWDKNYRTRPKSFLTEMQNRPNLKGKELTVPTKLNHMECQVKPAKDSEEVKTDVELNDLYLNTRKRKYNGESSDDETKQKHTDGRRRRKYNDGSSYEDSSEAKISQGSKAEFFSSLVKADYAVATSQTPKKEDDRLDTEYSISLRCSDFSRSKDKENSTSPWRPDKEEKSPWRPDKENNLSTNRSCKEETSPSIPDKETSPRRNKFAIQSHSKKHKFDLNAPKEVVKSRFFTSSENTEATNENKASFQDSSENNTQSLAGQQNNTRSGLQNITPSGLRTGSDKKSAFSWCRVKSTGNLQSSQSSRNPFKSVICSDIRRIQSQNNIDRSVTNDIDPHVIKASTHNDVITDLAEESLCKGNNPDITDLTEVSLCKGNNPDITDLTEESLCKGDNPDITDLTEESLCKGDNPDITDLTEESLCKGDNPDITDLTEVSLCKGNNLDITDMTEDTPGNGDIITIDDPPKSKTAVVRDKSKLMSGCRVSGLTKRKLIPVDCNQKSLKDMFAKFSNTRSKNLPKLKHEMS